MRYIGKIIFVLLILIVLIIIVMLNAGIGDVTAPTADSSEPFMDCVSDKELENMGYINFCEPYAEEIPIVPYHNRWFLDEEII